MSLHEARGAKRPEINFGRVGDVDLSHVPPLEDCVVGLEPTEYNIVIAPAVMPEKIGSIFIADTTKESLEMAMQVGRIIAVSPIAFNFEVWPKGAKPPGVGDVVWFARYAGGELTGADGRTYRMLKDKDIMAVIKRHDPQKEST